MSDDLEQGFSNQTSISELIDSTPGFGRVTKTKLENAGYETVGDLRKTDESELCEIKQIGTTTAKNLLDFVARGDDTDSTSGASDCTWSDDTPLEKWAETIPKVGRVKQVHLKRSGYDTVGDLREVDEDDLTEVNMVGPTRAQRILESVNQNSAQQEVVDPQESYSHSKRNVGDEKGENLDTVEVILHDLDVGDG